MNHRTRSMISLIVSLCLIFFCMYLHFRLFGWEGISIAAFILILVLLFCFAREIDD